MSQFTQKGAHRNPDNANAWQEEDTWFRAGVGGLIDDSTDNSYFARGYREEKQAQLGASAAWQPEHMAYARRTPASTSVASYATNPYASVVSHDPYARQSAEQRAQRLQAAAQQQWRARQVQSQQSRADEQYAQHQRAYEHYQAEQQARSDQVHARMPKDCVGCLGFISGRYGDKLGVEVPDSGRNKAKLAKFKRDFSKKHHPDTNPAGFDGVMFAHVISCVEQCGNRN